MFSNWLSGALLNNHDMGITSVFKPLIRYLQISSSLTHIITIH